MSLGIRYKAEVFDRNSKKVVEDQVLLEQDINIAKDFNEFGLRHNEQITLIEKAQDILLNHQSKLYSDADYCPRCGKTLRREGTFNSDFHDVLTDHIVSLRRLTCTCGWKNKFSVNALFGSATHPELLKKQLITGSDHSFEKSSSILNGDSGIKRSINNSSTIRKKVNKCGTILGELKIKDSWASTKANAEELIVQTDGGHIQYIEKGRHSFEEMLTTIFQPQDLKAVNNNRNELKNKICVGSAKSDKQNTIKKLTINACKKMGMNTNTNITALSDGAKNCWSVLEVLASYCNSFITVLDWFHIAKHFTSRKSKIPEDLIVKYNKAKWHLFHGHPKSAILRLEQVKTEANNSGTDDAVDWLINYISNNKKHIVDYHQRKLAGLTYSSQTAENSVCNVINSRQKNQKMRWSRNGAHSIIQIRTSIYSKTWYSDWQYLKSELYKEAV